MASVYEAIRQTIMFQLVIALMTGGEVRVDSYKVVLCVSIDDTFLHMLAPAVECTFGYSTYSRTSLLNKSIIYSPLNPKLADICVKQ